MGGNSMKRSTLLAALIFLALILAGICSQAQTYTLKAGKIEKTAPAKTKKADSVVKVIDGVTFYQGAKSGIYYWKTSKKTGLKYKAYLKAK